MSRYYQGEESRAVNNLIKYTSLFPVFFALFITYATLKLNSFYGSFGIHITEFISFSEIISYFIEDVFIIILFVTYCIIGITVANNRLHLHSSKSKYLSSNNTKHKSIIKNIYHFLIYFLLVLFLYVLSFDWVVFFVINAFFLFMFSLVFIIKPPQLAWYLIPIFFMLYYGLNESRQSASLIKANLGREVHFKTDDLEFKSDSNHVFIGKTADYIFIYDIKKSTNNIYKTSNLEFLNIGPIRDKNYRTAAYNKKIHSLMFWSKDTE